MMFAEEVVEEVGRTPGPFHVFDLIVFAFTIIIAIGVMRLLSAKERNRFAIGFAGVCLAIFLFLDVLVVLNWIGLLGQGA